MSMIDNYVAQINGLNGTVSKSKAWFEEHQDKHNELNKALSGFNELPFAIPIFGGSGEKFVTVQPWHHLFFEAEQDLDSAILLLIMGFYKDSFRSLRSFIELYIFGLYHFINEDEQSFEDWLKGKKGTPKIGQLLEAISKKNSHINSINKQFNWSNSVEYLYRELSGFMHTRGALHTHTALRNSNMTSFSEFGIKTGVEFLIRGIRLVAMGFSVNFPMSFQPLPIFEKFAFNQPAGGFLEEDQVEQIKQIFPVDISVGLTKICLSNEEANSLSDGIRSMADLTEQEIFESLKKTIDGDSFINCKSEIVKMLKNNEINKAISMIRAVQRAQTKTLTMVLFNPFYEQLAER